MLLLEGGQQVCPYEGQAHFRLISAAGVLSLGPKEAPGVHVKDVREDAVNQPSEADQDLRCSKRA